MDEWTDMTKPIGAFRDYANTPKNYQNSKFYFYFGVTILAGFFEDMNQVSQECWNSQILDGTIWVYVTAVQLADQTTVGDSSTCDSDAKPYAI